MNRDRKIFLASLAIAGAVTACLPRDIFNTEASLETDIVSSVDALNTNAELSVGDFDSIDYLMTCEKHSDCQYMGSVEMDWYKTDVLSSQTAITDTLSAIEGGTCSNVAIASVVYDNWSDGNFGYQAFIIGNIIDNEISGLDSLYVSSGEYPFSESSPRANKGKTDIYCTGRPLELSVG